MEAPVTLDEFLEGPDEAIAHEVSLRDPDRVVRLEWRCVRRPENSWLTCHSLIEGHLADGRRLRFQKFSNTGFSASILAANEATTEGSIYQGREANSQDMYEPVVLGRDLIMAAEDIGSQLYDICLSNCHHFARDLWNAIVSEPRRSSSYPDRMKSNVLRGAQRLSLTQLPAVFARNDLVCANLPSDDEGEECDQSVTEADFQCGWQLSMRQEETNRVTGVLCTPDCKSPCYNRLGRLQDFTRLLAGGVVHILQAGAAPGLVPVEVPSATVSATDDKTEVWAATWLNDDSVISSRLAERITGLDLVNLMLKLPDENVRKQSDKTGRSILNSLFVGSLDHSRRQADGNLVQDLCFVVLRSKEELRLAVYAVLRPVVGAALASLRRLRLLSGNSLNFEDNRFDYTIRDLDDDTPSCSTSGDLVAQAKQPSALDIAEGETSALQTAVATGDWGFVTLL